MRIGAGEAVVLVVDAIVVLVLITDQLPPSTLLRQFARPQEHPVEHGLGEDAGEGVLLGGMVTAEEGQAGGCFLLGAMSELGFRSDSVEAQRGVPGEGAEADENLSVGEQL